MRILSWVQTKINGKPGTKKRSEAAPVRDGAVQGSCKEEFSDWPQGLLAIGTLGNNGFTKQSNSHEHPQNSHALQDLPEFTLEEVNKLERELISLLSLEPKCRVDPRSETGKRCHSGLPDLSKCQDCCPSTLVVNQSMCQKFCEELERGEDGDRLSPGTNIILNNAKDSLGDQRNDAIGRKSISFLLRKLFLCRSEFDPAPSVRDPISESRMEKFLKAVLHKKIYPKNAAPTTVKKYLGEKQMDKAKIRDKIRMMAKDKSKEKTGEGCKWVKTDSEYIVLEM